MKRRTTLAWLTGVPLSVRIAGLYAFLLIGFGIGGFAYTEFASQATPVAAKTPTVVQPQPTVEVEKKEGVPNRIVVPRLGVDLTVLEGLYDPYTQTWTLDESNAFFAVLTTQPNDQSGNTFIYGHNQAAVFEPLAGLQVGDTVDLYTHNGLHFTYTYTRDTLIPPTMTQILYEKAEKPQLILMTCEGILSEARRIMYFEFTEVRDERV